MLLAVAAALASAACFAGSSVAQQRAASRAPESDSLRPRLLAHLARRAGWLLGLGASAGAFALQAVALHYGGLVLVQPLIVTELLFALPIAVRLRHRRLGVRDWSATAAVAGGLAAFLVAARPRGGHPDPSLPVWGLMAGAALVAVAGCLAVARSRRRALRPTMLGVCAGLSFGLLAALLDSVTYVFAHDGLLGALQTWQPYLLALVAPAGELVAQSAFQAGPLPASLPAIDTVEPGVAIAIGVTAFGEQVQHSPGALAVQAAGVVLAVVGIIVLDRSPLILELRRETRRAERAPTGAAGPRGSGPDGMRASAAGNNQDR